MTTTDLADTLDRTLEKFPGARRAGNSEFSAKCPNHDDRHASLCIGVGDDRILIKCQAGCDTKDVLARAGLTFSDLFPPRENHNGRAKVNGNGRRIVDTYDYPSAEGELLYQAVRYSPKGFTQRRPDGAGGWIWNMQGVQRVLYRLPELLNSREDEPGRLVFVVEGEQDANNLAELGIIATTNVSGAGKWKGDDGERYAETLRGERLVIIPDNDDAGRKHAQDIARACHGKAAEVRILELAGLPPKGDVTDWLTNGGTAADLIKLAAAAPVWTATEATADHKSDPRSVRQLMQAFPTLRPPVIHGLIRRGETMNVIAPPKTGKSWLVTDLAIAVATGRVWLGQFQTEAGDVLILDNELHGETSAARIPKVAHARGVLVDEFADKVYVENLRGKLRDVFNLRSYFDTIEPGRFKVVILDAFYRFLPRDTDENDNGTIASIYSQLDQYADRLGCCFILIHHSTKGTQSEKAVTDVGAGAGSQSRATDTHLVLRQHEQDGAVVLDAAVRSWAPIDPVCLRWQFPIWTPDENLDPSDLKRANSKRRERKQENQQAEPEAVKWTVELFVGRFIGIEPRTVEEIVIAADAQDISDRKARTFIKAAEAGRKIFRHAYGPRMPVKYCTAEQAVLQTAGEA